MFVPKKTDNFDEGEVHQFQAGSKDAVEPKDSIEDEHQNRKLYKKALRKQLRQIECIKKRMNQKKQTLIFPINEQNDWIEEEEKDQVDQNKDI